MTQACPACGTAIDTTDAEPLARVACPRCGEKMRVERTFDHFVLLDTHGLGGMGTVYKVLESCIQVAKGLRAAYRQGLIHRDVKPANILFVDEQTAKISDFGLAGAATQKSETREEIWGTPYYVAPERLNNAPEDFRSDIY